MWIKPLQELLDPLSTKFAILVKTCGGGSRLKPKGENIRINQEDIGTGSDDPLHHRQIVIDVALGTGKSEEAEIPVPLLLRQAFHLFIKPGGAGEKRSAKGDYARRRTAPRCATVREGADPLSTGNTELLLDSGTVTKERRDGKDAGDQDNECYSAPYPQGRWR
jgi:hypothetical protein